MATRSGRRHEVIDGVSRAADLLCCFSPSHLEWGVTELAEYLGFPKSVTHRLLTTLEEAGFVERTGAHRYRLGLRVLELGNVLRFQHHLLGTIEHALHSLAHETGSCVHLAKLQVWEVLELFRADTQKVWAGGLSLRMQVHSTALGKVLLAHAGEEALRQFVGLRKVFKRITPKTITDPEVFKAHLEEVRKAGYAIDDEETRLKNRCVAVPVKDQFGRVTAAMSITNSTAKLTDSAIALHLPAMYRTAGSIGRLLPSADGDDSGAARGAG